MKQYYNVWGQDGFNYERWGEKCFDTAVEAQAYADQKNSEEIKKPHSSIPDRYYVTIDFKCRDDEYIE